MKKFLTAPAICALSLAFLFTANSKGKEGVNSHSHILATNFPTPGWPVCSKCGKYHPGESCPKDKDGRLCIKYASR